MRNYIARRFQTAQDSVMASAAAEKGAYSDLIDLSIGDTDFTTDERIIRAAMEDALAGHTTRSVLIIKPPTTWSFHGSRCSFPPPAASAWSWRS